MRSNLNKQHVSCSFHSVLNWWKCAVQWWIHWKEKEFKLVYSLCQLNNRKTGKRLIQFLFVLWKGIIFDCSGGTLQLTLFSEDVTTSALQFDVNVKGEKKWKTNFSKLYTLLPYSALFFFVRCFFLFEKFSVVGVKLGNGYCSQSIASMPSHKSENFCKTFVCCSRRWCCTVWKCIPTGIVFPSVRNYLQFSYLSCNKTN